MTTKCSYPNCRASVEEENAFCGEHQAATCAYPLHEPLCQEHVRPNSAYCFEHDVVAGFFIKLHDALHQQAAAKMAAAKQQQAIIERAKIHLRDGHN